MVEYKYILVSGGQYLNNLGHELFWTRKIVLLLLYSNLIDNNITIITSSEDRFFLYKKYFNNVIVYNNLIENLDNILDLREYLSTITEKIIEQLKPLGLDGNLIDNNIFQNTNTDEFNKYVCNFDLDNSLKEFCGILDNKFFVIHIRPTCNYVNYLLDFINFSNINVIIFTNKEIDYPHKTNNLYTYASLLNDKNCLGLIGEWSGGSQLSQFCCKKVIYYFDEYPKGYNDLEKKNYENNNNNNFNWNWDHYNPYKTEKYFLELTEFLDMNNLISLIS
jgi:hypothetical protein